MPTSSDMRPIITVENVSKQYRLGTRDAAYDTLRDSVVGAITAPFRKNRKSRKNGIETIWALKDINLDVKPGEVVGIIGRNGAGKSTLLKILSRIVEPTTGSIKLYGRVGSLLEVGTGFHPELTGRENIYLNGAILGMRRTEISKKFDEIVAFAEIEQFIDTPVKRYSSGMYMRLAFAVAAHLEPEILIVDEVLAVGDATFQKKCLGKMGDVAQHGRTVLFVSHNMAAIGRLCRKALYLEKGKAVAYADARTIISQYMSSAHIETNSKEWQDVASAPGDEYLRILSIDIQDQDHKPLLRLRQNEPFIISIVYRVLKSMPNANVGFELKAEDGTIICWSFDADNVAWAGQGRKAGDYKIECTIQGNLLNEGLYYITLLGGIPFVRVCVRVEDILRLAVDAPYHGDEAEAKIGIRKPGIIAPEFRWHLMPMAEQ